MMLLSQLWVSMVIKAQVLREEKHFADIAFISWHTNSDLSYNMEFKQRYQSGGAQ